MVICQKKEKNLAPVEKILGEYGDVWVWTSFDPVHKLFPAFVVGKRTQENADLLIQRTKDASDGHIPFYTSDELPHYENSLLAAYGILEKIEGKPGPVCRSGRQRGRPRKPRLLPPPDLRYAVVEKTRRKGRVISIDYKVIFGKEEEIQELLADSAVSAHINTAFVERHNLTLRQHSRRLTRKTNGFSKERYWLERQLHLFFGYYHFCLPHGGLRRKLEHPLPTKGNGSLRTWVNLTPTMSAGITDYVWSMQELVNYRLPAQILAKVVKGH